MVASEASGEQLGAALIEASRAAGLALDFAGVVGPRLQDLGVRSLFDGHVLAVVGLVEVLGSFRRIRALLHDIDDYLRRERPDLVVLIDHPDFNLRVAARAKAYGIPVLYYVSPQVWAWRAGRIHKIAQLVDHMMVLFPFEAPLYEAAGVPVTVVSHPLLAKTAGAEEQAEARRRLGLPVEGEYVALLPGSRNGEIQRLAPRLARSARLLQARRSGLRFLAPLARPGQRELFERLWREATPDFPPPLMLEGQAQRAIRAADAVVVASGTATLETALLERPAVVVYAVNPITYAIAKRLVKVPFIALPNLLLQRLVYPELIQSALRPEAVAEAVQAILDGGGAAQRQALQSLRQLLQGEGPERVAGVLRQVLGEA